MNKPSQNFLKEAVSSIPGKVIEGELTFAASGLAGPEKEDQITPYAQECQRLGIIPGTHLRYEFHQSLFRTPTYEAATFPQLTSFAETPVELLLKGGRIHVITFKFQGLWGNHGFKLLREHTLEKLLEADYHFNYSSLKLAREYVSNTRLVFNRGNWSSIRLIGGEAGNIQEDGYHEELHEWFRDLAKRYQYQILIPNYS